MFQTAHTPDTQRHRTPPAQPDTDWHMLSHVVVRRAGFPFDWLERLDTPETARRVEQLAQLHAEIDSEIDALLHVDFPAAVDGARSSGDQARLHALSKLRTRVGRRAALGGALERSVSQLSEPIADRLATLAGLQVRVQALREEAQAVLDDEWNQKRATLRELIADSFFQEAIFLSNPDLYNESLSRLLADPRRQLDSAFERRLLAYLQRFCAKNDTASFFGPLNCLRVVPEQREPILLETQGSKYTRREVFIGFWVADRLAELISADPSVQPHLRPRVHPMCAVDGDTVWLASRDQRVRLNALQQRILRHVDERATVRDIAQTLGEPEPTVQQEIRTLASARVVVCRLEIPSTIFHPFSELIRRVAALPAACERRGYWVPALHELERLRQAFVTADLPSRRALLAELDARYTTLTGEPARRSAGATYADRLLIYEDCAGTLDDFRFSGAFFEDLQRRLTPILDLCAAHASLLWRHYQALGRRVFEDLSPDGRPVPYARFISSIRRQPPAAEDLPSARALRALADGLATLVQDRSDGHVARLEWNDVRHLLSEVPSVRNCHLSPDVMLGAASFEHLRRGDYQVILGEVHQVFYAWGSQLYFWPQRAQAEAEMAAHVQHMPDYAGLGTLLNERQHKGLLNETFPGTLVEVAAIASPQARERVPLTRLEVALDGEHERLILRDTHSGRELRIYTAGDEQLHLWAFAVPRAMPVPVRLGTHTPRIEIDGAVYQRERWSIPTADWGSAIGRVGPLELMERAQQVRNRYRMPQRLFVLAPSEPKPFYIDFGSVMSLRLLQQLLAVDERMVFSEMLPGPDGLWLTEDGERFCCEFRMTACRY